MVCGISGTNSSFRVEWRTAGGGLISVFQEFFASIKKTFILVTELSFWGLDIGLTFHGV